MNRYDFSWHESHGDLTSSSAKCVAPVLHSLLGLDSVLDVGCGDGRWLAVFKECGTPEIAGIDGPWTDSTKLQIETSNFSVQELSETFDLKRRFCLAVSLEVAEHVKPQFAKRFVHNLVRHSDVILFAAAIPFQGGFRHVNEQWQSYWAALFKLENFDVSDIFRARLWDRDDVWLWYKQNMLLYVNRSRRDLIARVNDYIVTSGITQMPLDVVHPVRYTTIASYSQIAFKPLLRSLPRATMNKLAAILKLKR